MAMAKKFSEQISVARLEKPEFEFDSYLYSLHGSDEMETELEQMAVFGVTPEDIIIMDSEEFLKALGQ